MYGEKSMSNQTYGANLPSNVVSGSADEESVYNGFDDDFIRMGSTAGWAAALINPPTATVGNTASGNSLLLIPLPPAMDTNIWPQQSSAGCAGGATVTDYAVTFRFGSAHSSAFNMAFCDGSVHSIAYDVDPSIHGQLSNRQDGATPDETLYLAP